MTPAGELDAPGELGLLGALHRRCLVPARAHPIG